MGCSNGFGGSERWMQRRCFAPTATATCVCVSVVYCSFWLVAFALNHTLCCPCGCGSVLGVRIFRFRSISPFFGSEINSARGWGANQNAETKNEWKWADCGNRKAIGNQQWSSATSSFDHGLHSILSLRKRRFLLLSSYFRCLVRHP